MNKLMIRYEMIGAYNENEMRHPQEVIVELSEKLNFSVEKYYPVSIADCWLVWIEGENLLTQNDFPKYIHVFDEYKTFEEWNKPKK
jgi:hypothetical protein